MSARWVKPDSITLVARLDEINKQLTSLCPQLLEMQAESVKRMAETAILAQGGKLPQEDKAHG
jgi:hypothetical protein